MELYQLKTFVTVATIGHLTRAADLLHTSQPAVSAQIKALEEELGITLFERTPKGMTLTAEGERVREYAERTLEAAGNLLHQAKSMQNELVGEVRVGVNSDFEFLRLPAVHRLLADHHSKLTLCILGGVSQDILQDIAKGTLDAGFFFGPPNSPEINAIRLTDAPMRVVGPVAWRAQIDQSDLAAISRMPWILAPPACPFARVIEQLFGERPTNPTSTLCADSEEGVRKMVASGAGLSVMREADALRWQQEKALCIWPGEAPSIALHFGFRRQKAGDPMINAVLASVLQAWHLGQLGDQQLAAG